VIIIGFKENNKIKPRFVYVDTLFSEFKLLCSQGENKLSSVFLISQYL
jgi:hypothetical protein